MSEPKRIEPENQNRSTPVMNLEQDIVRAWEIDKEIYTINTEKSKSIKHDQSDTLLV